LREQLAGYGVNSGIGRSGKVLRRTLRLPDNTSVVTDEVVAAARAIDPRTLITAICDERLHFLQSLKTWPVFCRGWSRRVAEVKSTEDGSGSRQARRHGSQVNLINNWELHRCGIRSGSGSEIP
jgi:lysozyme family protein